MIAKIARHYLPHPPIRASALPPMFFMPRILLPLFGLPDPLEVECAFRWAYCRSRGVGCETQ